MRTLWTLLLLLAALVAALAWSLSSQDSSPGSALAPLPSPVVAPDASATREISDDGAQELERDALAPSAAFIAARAREDREQLPKARLTGRLVDETGAPIEGARVYYALAERGPDAPLDSAVWAQPDRRRGETHSDPDGRFSVSPAPVGWVRVALRPTEHEPRDLDGLLVAEAQELELGELVLALGARRAGRVLDSNDVPVADAWVIRPSDPLRPALGREPGDRGVVLARTDANGAFDLRGQPHGPWTLLAHSPEFPDVAASGGGERSSGDELHLLLRFPPTASLRGRVLVGDALHAPAPQTLEVVAYPSDEAAAGRGEASPSRRRAQLSASGEFEIRGVAPQAAYRVRAALASGTPRGDEVLFEGGVDARGGDQDLELRIASVSSISFAARDAVSGAPIEDLRAQLFARDAANSRRPLEALSKSEGDGLTRVLTDRALRPGERVSLTLSAVRYFSLETADFVLERGASVDLGQLELRPRPRLEARVVDPSTGRGVKGARVWMALDPTSTAEPPNPRQRGENASLRSEPTDEEGRATLYGHELDCGQVTARADGYASAEATPVCFSSSSGTLELLLSPGATLLVRVRGAGGAPAPSRRVQLQLDSAVTLPLAQSLRFGELGQSTDPEGVARFEGATPGSYRVSLLEPRCGAPRSALEHARAFAAVSLSAGQEHELELFALPRGTLSGRVTSGRRPLAHAAVSLSAPRSSYPSALSGRSSRVEATTDAEGRYRIDDLGAGAWNVAISHPEFIAPTRISLDYDGDERTLDLDVPRTALVGRIVDPGGNPIAGARLVLGRWQPARRTRDRRASPFEALPNGGPLTPTGDDGAFLVLGAPAERLALEVRHPDYQTLQTEPFVPTAGLEHPLGDLVLVRAGRVAVELQHMTTDAPRPRVILRRLDGPKNEVGEREVRSASLDVRGKALLRSLAPGKWRVELDPRVADQPRPRKDVQVRAGQTNELMFESL